MNILLVEDNNLDALILERALKKVSPEAKIIRARDGLEALDILTADSARSDVPHPFFILLDINMPRMNGHEFLAAMRAQEAISDCPVFVLTTSDSPKDISLAYHQKVSGYIVKPHSASGMKKIVGALQEWWDICELPAAFSA
ncbi:response regulator [Roseobacteraceae bacterium NS-SX3]